MTMKNETNRIICIYHSRDLDGWMSAAIVKKWFEENSNNPLVLDFGNDQNHDGDKLFMMAWDYGDIVPGDFMKEYDKVIMCDVSFPTDIMWELRSNLGKNFIWIDHHSSVIKDNIPKEHKQPVFEGLQDTNFAACELTWMYFMQGIRHNEPDAINDPIPELVRLIGRYDCFGHKGTDEEQKVLEFQYAARADMENYTDCYSNLLRVNAIGEKTDIDFMLDRGKIIYKYLCIEAKQTFTKSFPINFDERIFGDEKNGGGYTRKFLCVNHERFNPVNFEINYHEDGYDGYACFWYKNGTWSWSLYNDNGEVDCSEIAKQYKGGGHPGASGFVLSSTDNEKLLRVNTI